MMIYLHVESIHKSSILQNIPSVALIMCLVHLLTQGVIGANFLSWVLQECGLCSTVSNETADG